MAQGRVYVDIEGYGDCFDWAKEGHRVHFGLGTPLHVSPKLDVPEAPKSEPEPPESASVQMLRKLLADRRAELKRAERNRLDYESEVKRLEALLEEGRRSVVRANLRMEAATASIDQVLADIAALGGRPE